MTRITKLMSIVGLASVTLMQLPCVNTGSGIAIPALKVFSGQIKIPFITT